MKPGDYFRCWKHLLEDYTKLIKCFTVQVFPLLTTRVVVC